MGKGKIPRFTSHLRTRSRGFKTRHIIYVSICGILWYVMVTRIKTIERSSTYPSINNILPHRDSWKNKIHKETYIPLKEKVAAEDDDRNVEKKRKNNRYQESDENDVTIENNSVNSDSSAVTEDESNSREETVPIKTKPSIILVWKAMEYQMKNYKKHLEYYAPEECGGCQVTTNRSLVKECSALVHFNAPDLQRFMDVPDPSVRNPDQIYAFWSRETPSKTYKFRKALQDPRFDSIFNITMNFRQDSDIIDYFGNVEYELRFFQTKNRDGRWLEKIMKRKNALAIWVVSNCNSTYGASERMKYAKSLIDAGLDLTGYGSCFGRRYDKPDIIQEIMRHRFYLSFENSVHCPDYLSEKFWRNGFRGGAVPVVWGARREDVAVQAPPHSYIHTEDFETPEKLVQYLNYLNKNDTAYTEYHAWRFQAVNEDISENDIAPNHQSTLCRLCKRVVRKPLIHKSIPSVYKWLYESRYTDDLCFK